jgi:hypothetical protein
MGGAWVRRKVGQGKAGQGGVNVQGNNEYVITDLAAYLPWHAAAGA